jgi:peroxiredoxin Q/BCP
MLREGERAPDVAGITAEGARVALRDYRGKRAVVVFFYPRDNTTVCTREACGFRDHASEIAAAGGSVIGISMDSPVSHRRFIDDHRLNFPLLSDRSGAICKAFGVARLGGWLPPRRVTFVIDREGIVRRVITGEFDANRHIDGALVALREVAAPPASGLERR